MLDFAARLLPVAAPDGRGRRSRCGSGRRPPRHRCTVADGDRFATAVAEAAALADEGFLVGCIVAAEHVDDDEPCLRRRPASTFGAPERDGLVKPITVLPAPTAKGLEFDAVVVVEPAAIAGDTARGLRLLYVALTRPIQHLAVVHARPFPAALRLRDAGLDVRR